MVSIGAFSEPEFGVSHGISEACVRGPRDACLECCPYLEVWMLPGEPAERATICSQRSAGASLLISLSFVCVCVCVCAALVFKSSPYRFVHSVLDSDVQVYCPIDQVHVEIEQFVDAYRAEVCS